MLTKINVTCCTAVGMFSSLAWLVKWFFHDSFSELTKHLVWLKIVVVVEIVTLCCGTSEQ